jgi:hypothetical protein
MLHASHLCMLMHQTSHNLHCGCRRTGPDGINGIKDTYVVCKYVKKTLLELGFMGYDTYLWMQASGTKALAAEGRRGLERVREG